MTLSKLERGIMTMNPNNKINTYKITDNMCITDDLMMTTQKTNQTRKLTRCNMILKKGITGFYDSKDLPVPQIDFKDFKTLCHTIDNGTVWQLINISKNPYCNYYSAEFNTELGTIHILLNKYYPIIGFTEEIRVGNILFKDINDINYLLVGYEIMSAEILNGSLDNVENELSKTELKQVEYHNPNQVGNVVFNCWD